MYSIYFHDILLSCCLAVSNVNDSLHVFESFLILLLIRSHPYLWYAVSHENSSGTFTLFLVHKFMESPIFSKLYICIKMKKKNSMLEIERAHIRITLKLTFLPHSVHLKSNLLNPSYSICLSFHLRI